MGAYGVRGARKENRRRRRDERSSTSQLEEVPEEGGRSPGSSKSREGDQEDVEK